MFARTKRWTEEVRLLKEEMRCVPVTLCWKAGWWEDRRVVEEFIEEHAEGVSAYAARQADLMRRLAKNFEEMWAGTIDLEIVPCEAERRAEELATAAAAGDDDDEDEDADDNEVPEDGEERMEGDEQGSVGGEEDNGDDE